MSRLPGILLAAGLLAALPAAAEEGPAPVRVEVTADRSRATVGDRIGIKVTLVHPRDVRVAPPVPLPPDGSSLAVEAAPSPPPPSHPARGEPGAVAPEVRELFFFHAQAFETGTLRVPSFRVDWTRESGASGSVQSDPVPVEIVSVLKGPEEKPADLKPPAVLPPPPFPWRTAAGVLLLAVLAALAATAWRRRKKITPALPAAEPTPGLPPHEQAYRELERLLGTSLLREGRVKEFHVELAEILKRYLAGRFEIETLERTSEEVLDEMKRVRVGVAPLGTAREFFSETDLVKFARDLPSEEEIRRTVERAYRLVDLTKLVPPAPAAAVGQAPPGLSTEQA